MTVLFYITNQTKSILMKLHEICLISACAYVTLRCYSIYVNVTSFNSDLNHVGSVTEISLGPNKIAAVTFM